MDNWNEPTRTVPPVPMYVLTKLPEGVKSPADDATAAPDLVDWLLRALNK